MAFEIQKPRSKGMIRIHVGTGKKFGRCKIGPKLLFLDMILCNSRRGEDRGQDPLEKFGTYTDKRGVSIQRPLGRWAALRTSNISTTCSSTKIIADGIVES